MVDSDPAEVARVVATHAFSAWYVCHEAVPHLLDALSFDQHHHVLGGSGVPAVDEATAVHRGQARRWLRPRVCVQAEEETGYDEPHRRAQAP